MPTNHDETLLERYTREAEIDARMMAKLEKADQAPDGVPCSCGDLYPAGSFGAGFIHGSGMCENCDAAMPARDPATSDEQQPVSWQARFIEEGNDGWGACALEHHEMVRANPREWPGYETRELYAAPIAQAAPRPTGLSKGWNLTRQHDGFVIGHSSKEPSEKDKKQAILDGRVYVPFLVAQAAPQPEQSGLVEALESAVHLMDLMQDDIDSLIGYAGGTGGFGEYRDRINGISDALSAQGEQS